MISATSQRARTFSNACTSSVWRKKPAATRAKASGSGPSTQRKALSSSTYICPLGSKACCPQTKRSPMVISRKNVALDMSPLLEPDESWRFPAQPSASTKIRSEEHTSELQSLMRISYAVFCLKKKKNKTKTNKLMRKKKTKREMSKCHRQSI